ncbi:T9SS type A sorting domain-containing protein [Ekhidna sp.]
MKIWAYLLLIIPHIVLPQSIQFHPGEKTICYASDKVENTHIPASFLGGRLANTTETSAEISVSYNGFTNEARIAFQYAVDIWAQTITSDVPIRVTANWSQLGPGVLGSASATSTVSNFENAPEKDTRYPLALAEKLARKQLNFESQSEVSANFNSQIDWYFGIDANPPSDQYDLVSVVLHEIGHGLGFSASFGANAQIAAWGLGNTGQPNTPIIYDLYLVDRLGNQLIDEDVYANNSAELLAAVTNNSVSYGSSLAEDVYGTFPPIFAPNPWNGGSSISHLDESVFPAGNENSLMSPQFGLGEAIHLPGEVTKAIFSQLGWVHTFIDHDEIVFAESPGVPVRFLIKLESDSLINASNTELIISEDNFNTSTIYNLSQSSNDDLYEISIPYEDLPDESSYYFRYTSPEGRIYQFPEEGFNNPLSVIKEQDNEGPSISHVPVSFILQEEFDIEFSVEDNFAIDTLYIEYKTTENGDSNYKGLDFEVSETEKFELNKSDLGLSEDDTLFYKIHALDVSVNQNTSSFPQAGFIRGRVINISEQVDFYSLSFDTPEAGDSLVLNNLKMETGEGFSSMAIVSDHPYKNDAQGLASFILKHPIRLKEDSKLSFDEILLIEPSTEIVINDYLIIEASSDNGNTWVQVGEIADASNDDQWLMRYNSNVEASGSLATGDASLYKQREIDLVGQALPFSSNDNLIIRFSFVVNSTVNGWGIRIDNLKIGDGIVSAVKSESPILIYPNPVYETLRINNAKSENYKMIIRALSGQEIDHIDLSENTDYKTQKLQPGIYLLEIRDERGKTIKTEKIIKK